ncbi:hypothetical protein [Zhaonella formicivorans]|uniref:hypothetical protein n=1 Tax=Zhaonella formicivorans TaxID=2528593 RepID=UPI001D0FFF14|nr:hypothetical protein [Zhaonella formicivorans]
MSGKKILCCGILRHELEHLLGEQNADITYIDAALHVDLNKLAQSVTENLRGIA